MGDKFGCVLKMDFLCLNKEILHIIQRQQNRFKKSMYLRNKHKKLCLSQELPSAVGWIIMSFLSLSCSKWSVKRAI